MAKYTKEEKQMHSYHSFSYFLFYELNTSFGFELLFYKTSKNYIVKNALYIKDTSILKLEMKKELKSRAEV